MAGKPDALDTVLTAVNQFVEMLKRDWGLEDAMIQEIFRSPAAKVFLPLIMLAAAYTGDEEFSPRMEANAIVAMVFRNGPLEDYHSGMPIGDAEMRELMISASRRMNSILCLRDILLSSESGQRVWLRMISAYHHAFCKGWEMKDIGESL